MRQKEWMAVLLALLLLSGCAAQAAADEPAPSPGPSPTAAPKPTPTPAPPAAATPTMSTAEDTDLTEVLYSAWQAGEEDREVFSAEGSGDIIARDDSTLYIIRKKQVGIYHAENGGFQRLCNLDVGFWWMENRDENGWIGCEKTPVELFVGGDRLAVLSEWVEYSESSTEAGREFRDLSRTVLDIFDVSNPAVPVPVASYAQDGGRCAGYIDGAGHLWLLSRRSVYEADHSTGGPAVYNSEHRMELEADCVDVQLEGGRAQSILLGLYDLTDGVRWDARCLIGGGERALMGETGVYILGGADSAEIIRYAVGSDSIAAPVSTQVEGHLLDAALGEEGIAVATAVDGALLFSALDGDMEPLWEREMAADARNWGFEDSCFWLSTEDGGLEIMNLSDRSLRSGEAGGLQERAGRIDESHWYSLGYSADGSALELSLWRAGAKGSMKVSRGALLGYTYRPAAEEGRGLWLCEGHMALASETGCSLYTVSPSGFVHRQDVFTADNSAHMRYFVMGDCLYIADTREVHALRLSDLAFVGEWFL